jgi:hypothetical protein
VIAARFLTAKDYRGAALDEMLAKYGQPTVFSETQIVACVGDA